MKNKEVAKNDDGSLDQKRCNRKKLLDKNTLILILIFSVTFFILGCTTSFLLFGKSADSVSDGGVYYVGSSPENPLTNDVTGIKDSNRQTVSSVESSADSVSSDCSADETASNSSNLVSKPDETENSGGKASATGKAGGGAENVPNNNGHSEIEFDGHTVYVTPSGKKYHYSPSCGGKNAYQTTLDEAVSAGKTPCKKCTQ